MSLRAVSRLLVSRGGIGLHGAEKGNLHTEGEQENSSSPERKRAKWLLFTIAKREAIIDHMRHNCPSYLGLAIMSSGSC